MKKLLFTLTFFCLAYYAQAQTFKPEQFDASWEVHCETCPEELYFTFSTKQEASFVRADGVDQGISWDIIGSNVLFMVTETPGQERTTIFVIKSVANDEIKLSTPLIRNGSPSPPETTLTLYKRKKGKLKPREYKEERPSEEKK